jgi:two-component system chemotaxis response regulator CheY
VSRLPSAPFRPIFWVKRLMHNILIVDDSPTIRRMVRSALRSLRVTIAEAGSGLEAIEQISIASVNLMVLDLNMPDMHGLDVLKFVRRHPQYAQVPVIVLTTRGDEISRTTALAAGATAYVTKPFSPNALADTVQSLLPTVRVQEVNHVDS